MRTTTAATIGHGDRRRRSIGALWTRCVVIGYASTMRSRLSPCARCLSASGSTDPSHVFLEGMASARRIPARPDNQILGFTLPTIVATAILQSECKQTAGGTERFGGPGPIQLLNYARQIQL